jgi:hypothetical protein
LREQPLLPARQEQPQGHEHGRGVYGHGRVLT